MCVCVRPQKWQQGDHVPTSAYAVHTGCVRRRVSEQFQWPCFARYDTSVHWDRNATLSISRLNQASRTAYHRIRSELGNRSLSVS